MDAKNLVVWALEASMYFDPRKPGLTLAELVELGAGFGVSADQVQSQLAGRVTEGARVLPFSVDPSMFGTYADDLRALPAFDHVVSTFNAAHRAAAAGNASVSREAVVAAGEAAGVPRVDVEFAVSMFRAFEGVPGADDRWVLRRVKPAAMLPSAQRSGPAGMKLTRREGYADLVAALRALVQRRGPGAAKPETPVAKPAAPVAKPDAPVAKPDAPFARPDAPVARPDAPVARPAALAAAPSSPGPAPRAARGNDPLAAFGAILPSLNQERLVPWWNQLAGELRAADDAATALTRCLLAAAMVEGALTMACRRAGLPRPDPRAPKPDPKTPTKPVRLTLSELARAAAAIGLDAELRGRVERLAKTRQRIQSSRLFDETGAWSKLTVEDAEEAAATLDATLGVLLEWHSRSPTAR